MAVVNHPSPPHNWRDAEGNIDWDAYADQAQDRLYGCTEHAAEGMAPDWCIRCVAANAPISPADWECYLSDHYALWKWLDYFVTCSFSAELHTMDLAMGCGTPPVARTVRR